jgi:OOP family OmpA-OmpF porin
MMKKGYLKFLLVLMLAIVTASCAARRGPVPESAFKPVDLDAKLRSGEYEQKVETFLVIFDASSTMSQEGKFEMAREVASRMNQTIPKMELIGALRSLGEDHSNETRLVYGTTRYKREGFETAISAVRGFGATPLGKAIRAATGDLSGTQGNTAVIILSDGRSTDGTALAATKEMKSTLGDRLCLYTVFLGDDPAGRRLMEEIVRVGECGYFVSAEEVYPSEGMATLAQNVFLEKAPPPPPPVGARLDGDGDGVPDDLDKCPGTPQGVKVDMQGCPVDSDGDGVADHLDKCPNTPKGATVNTAGCWAFGGKVLFGFNKYDLRREANPLLNEVVFILRDNPDMKLKVEGHTDNIGSAAYNQRLSERRANSVVEYLVGQGIGSHRLMPEGYGFTQPAASNETEEGRASNRRVRLTPIP